MDYLAICTIAVALAMDAFSVCISSGAIIKTPDAHHYFRLGFHFGLFQFMMPVIGYMGGSLLETYIEPIDHWIAMGLLSFIGLKMLKDAFSKDKVDQKRDINRDPSRGLNLIMLSIATSIDALAVGISLGILDRPIIVPSIIIGIICAAFSLLGLYLGKRAASYLGKKAEALGGVMLIIIGIKILFEHLA